MQWRVGDLLIDTGRQRVRRGENVIALPKLSYDLLLTLVRAAPNLVSLDGLMEQVWPKAVVSPETVIQRIKLLRDALGDDSRAPRYIEGLRGRGYRLIPSVAGAPEVVAEMPAPAEAPITPVAAPIASTQAPALEAGAVQASPLASPGTGRRRLLPWAVPIAVILIGGLFLLRHVVHPAAQQPATSVTVVADQPRSVAVLPFDNVSAEPSNDYIALGMADSVLHQLASSPDLIVISRSSSFAVGKAGIDPREAGRRLGVRYLVSGSVQRAGNVLRVTAQLIDTTTSNQLWSLKLDRTIDDVFALQDQIAQRVAQQLDVTMESRSLGYARYGTDAYLAFLKGRALIESRKVKDVEASIQQFSRAIDLAPTFAAAIAELARAKLQLASLQVDPNTGVLALWPEFDALVERAISIDPGAGEPYFLRALRRLDGNDTVAAEADFRKGLELAPNFSPGLRDYAEYLDNNQRFDEALEQLDRARLVEPLSAENHYRKGEILRGELLRLEDAAALYLQALSVQPEFYPAYTRLAQVRSLQGKLAEAIKYAEKSVAIESAVGWTRERLVWFYVDAGDLRAARDVLSGYTPGASEMADTEAVVCYRAGKLERAATLLRDNVGSADFKGNGFPVAVATNAIVDISIANHDPSRARQFILSLPGLKKDHATLAMVEDNFPQVIQLATVEHAVGDQAVANDLAERTLQYLDRAVGKVHFVGGWDIWARAAAAAILGRNDAALGDLEDLVHSGFRNAWWARIDRFAAFSALRSTPRFQAIVSGSQRWLEGELRQLELMRSRGEIPPRATERLSAQGC